MNLMKRTLLLLVLLFGSSAAWAQCAPGIPCGGNPMGIPPDAPGGPYQTHAGDYGAPAGGTEGGQASGGTTWAAFAINSKGNVGWEYQQPNARVAQRGAMAACKRMGAPGCEIIDSFTEVCGAPASDIQHELFIGWGTYREMAEKGAIEDCEQKSKAGQCRLVSLAICDRSDITTKYMDETSRRAATASAAELEKISAGYRKKR